MTAFISYLFMMLVIAPLQSAITEKIGPLTKSTELLQASRICATTAVPQLVDQAKNDFGWAAATAIRVTLGITPAVTLIGGRGAACDQVLRLIQHQDRSPGENV